MGITIYHQLSQKKDCVKSTLDRTQNLAEILKREQANKLRISFEIRRLSDYSLYIDIGNCETLSFNFQSVKEIKAEKEKKGWIYSYYVLTEDGKKELDEGYKIKEYPQNEIYYTAAFCKTQFAESLAEHRFIAEIIRSVASYCQFADVNDEGDYYHTGKIEDAAEAINENGKFINSVAGKLVNLGWSPDEIKKGGNTKIKPIR